MLKKYLKYYFVILSFIFFLDHQAQDVHYTQYSFLPLLQNPASSGFFNGNMRFSSIYRNQWATVPVNYNSLGFSFDLNFFENFKTGSKAGAGLNFYFDQAGDSKFQTLNLMVPIAYHFFLPINENIFKVSIGAEGGFQYKSLSTNDLYYNSQFNGEIFNANEESGEVFTNLTLINPDFGVGIQFEFETEKELKLSLGFSMKHINEAKESYINSNIKPTLRQRIVIPANIEIPMSPVWDLNLSYLFNFQNESQEHLMGAMLGYYLENIEVYKRKINFGVFYRLQDAISLAFQYETNQFKAGLSYDINASKFSKATSTYGGLELSIAYKIHNVLKPNLKLNKKCFTF